MFASLCVLNMCVCGSVCGGVCGGVFASLCGSVHVCVCTQCPLQSKIDCIFLPKKLSGSFEDPKNLTAWDIQLLF